MKMLGLDSIRVDRSTLEIILDQSGLDYSMYGALPAREVRLVDPESEAILVDLSKEELCESPRYDSHQGFDDGRPRLRAEGAAADNAEGAVVSRVVLLRKVAPLSKAAVIISCEEIQIG